MLLYKEHFIIHPSLSFCRSYFAPALLIVRSRLTFRTKPFEQEHRVDVVGAKRRDDGLCWSRTEFKPPAVSRERLSVPHLLLLYILMDRP